jgi:hypothetical protein
MVDREYDGDYGMPQWGDFAMVKVKEGADVPDLVTAGLFDEEWPRRRKAWGGGFGEPMVGAQAARFHFPVSAFTWRYRRKPGVPLAHGPGFPTPSISIWRSHR